MSFSNETVSGGTLVRDLPEQWRAAFERDQKATFLGNDPLPERRAARALAAFIATGLVFVFLPGTVLGVWNLLSIADERTNTGASTAWIQAHGQAQLFGWVGTFILGISLYVLPKFLGRVLTRFRLVWTVWALWTAGAAWHWWAGVSLEHWRTGLIGSAILQLAGFALSQYLLWFDRGGNADSGKVQKPFPGDLASWLGVVGFASFGVALLLNLGISTALARHAALPVYPPAWDRTFLLISLWGFAIPVAWGYSSRFITIFVGLEKPVQKSAKWLAMGVAVIVICALAGKFLAADALAVALTAAAIYVLQVFRPSVREPKRLGVYGDYPIFARIAFGWVAVGAVLGVWADLAPKITGLGGASRHALTVGFLATLIFCVAPLILPSFLSGRELRSIGLMAASLWLLEIGCLLRVTSEAVAYSHGGFLWSLLPVSGWLELTAVCLFVLNMGMTMLQPLPAWFSPSGIQPSMSVYFCVASFPKTRQLFVKSGLKTLAHAPSIPRTLSIAEAAAADGADAGQVMSMLREFFGKRQPRRRGREP
ncbi:MAG TPA: NnrS family protein [Candidatus Acidoferrales bacterium]|nr:NnrS family protein [Candidatus Acidoferrales bacterium]